MRSFGIDRQTRPQRNGDFRGRFFPRPQNALWGAAAVLLSVLLSVSPVSAQSDSSEPFDPIKENGEYFTGW